MAELPDEMSYGQRPSNRVNRIDRPPTGGVELAEALNSAIEGFDRTMQEKKEKENNFQYALARNEFMQANIEEQEALSEDRDWRTHDKRYQENLGKRYEEITKRRLERLSPHDRGIFESEAKLITAKGRVSLGAKARELEIDEALGELSSSIKDMEANILVAQAGERNEMVMDTLDLIEAAREEGYLTDTQAEAKRTETAQSLARSSLKVMPAEQRRKMLEATQAYRFGFGGKGKYTPLIFKYAGESGLPPQLVAAQISMESSGDPNAKSYAYGDPTGLMQLGEDAATDMGVTDRTDAEQNIRGGTQYLANLEKRFDGDREKALAAYNWGASNVLEAFDQYGDDWLANAPEETRNYVAKLMPHWDGTAPPPKYMTKTNTGMGALTQEDVREGKGTGFISDLLPADEVATMLKAAYNEDKDNQERIQSQNAVAAANRRFPATTQEGHEARLADIRRNHNGAVRDRAITEERQRYRDIKQGQADRSYELYQEHAELMRDSNLENPYGFNDIPPEDMTDMSEAHVRALKEDWQAMVEDRRYGEVTQYEDPGDGSFSIEEWNDLPNWGQGSKSEIDLEQPWVRMSLNAEDHAQLVADQALLRKIDAQTAPIPNVEPYIDDVFEATEFMSATKRTDTERAKYARFKQRVVNRVIAMQSAMTPQRQLDGQEINKVISDLYSQEALTYKGINKTKRVVDMTKAELNQAVIDVEQAKAQDYPTRPGEVPMTVYEFLVQQFKELNPNQTPDEDRLSSAYFALEAGLGTAEMNRRLKGE